MNFDIKVDVSLKSGARIALTDAQKTSIHAFISAIIEGRSGEQRKAIIPKYHRRKKPKQFSSEEDAELKEMLRFSLGPSKEKKEAIDRHISKWGRDRMGIYARLHKLRTRTRILEISHR